MTALEKAARAIYAARVKRNGFTVTWEQAGIVDQDRARHDAQAVISSIEVDDAMVIAAWHAMEPAVVLPEHAEAAIKAALRSILDEGEGR